MTESIAFAIHPGEPYPLIEVVPVVDGIELTDRIHGFELEYGMEARAVSYGGLVPAYYRFGPAEVHYLARDGAIRSDEGRVALLGCAECDEWGCWPLQARIIVGETTVSWTDFEQPFREERDYSAFGPFVFDRREYEVAVSELAPVWAAGERR